MSIDTLEETIKQVMKQSGSYVTFGWQGGEPTLMGLDFFKKVIEFQKKYGEGKTVGNGLQTNGILIDNEWVKFLNKYNFLIGLSIDGSEHIHDHYRKTKSQKGSWKKVLSASQILLEHGVEVNALTVVNDYSVSYPEEIYNFHKSIGLTYHQYIPCVERDMSGLRLLAKYSVEPKQFGEFLCKHFDL